MSDPIRTVTIAVVGSVFLSACAATPVIPPDLANRVDPTLPFSRILKDPASYIGKIVVAGGIILSSRRTEEATRLEILHLPLDRSWEPEGHLTDSKGRFLAFHKEFLDPATVPPGTRVTVVGELTGVITQPLDEITYDYPSIDIRSLTVWPSPPRPYGVYPYFGAYWGPYWGPYWYPWLFPP